MTDDRITAVRRQRSGLIVLAILGLLAAGVSYWGTRDWWSTAALPSPASSSEIGAPADEVVLPPGPHQAEFLATCIICHSARLPLHQPPFGREQWAEIVHKMVAAYGAPASPDEEAQIVGYLLAVQEPELPLQSR
jgi:hypothetical protein